MKLEQYILDEWNSMCDDAHRSLLTDCPLAEDEVLVEMRAYLNALESKNKALLQELIECSYEMCSCGHPACKACLRHRQLVAFIEEMRHLRT